MKKQWLINYQVWGGKNRQPDPGRAENSKYDEHKETYTKVHSGKVKDREGILKLAIEKITCHVQGNPP